MDETIELNPIHTRQNGFITDRNTDTHISNVVNYIEKHIHREQHVLAVFLDIQAAFDKIDPKQINKALLLHGVDSTLIKWYYHYITHRNLHKEVKGSQAKLSTTYYYQFINIAHYCPTSQHIESMHNFNSN